jgi:hypothetical protein
MQWVHFIKAYSNYRMSEVRELSFCIVLTKGMISAGLDVN